MINKLSKIGLFYRTVKHLKPIQVIYQVKNRLNKPKALFNYALPVELSVKLDFFPLPEVKQVLAVQEGKYCFDFLNLVQSYSGNIEWNDQLHGKLWNYNLQYVDFLRQEDIASLTRCDILLDLYCKLWSGNVPLEPYPVSLRIMNMIRFLSSYPEHYDKFKEFLYAEIHYISKNLEYHLLGNHLLENAFALLMGSYFFDHGEWKSKASVLLEREMNEQVMADGAHFELSPMYHQIILFRVLEAIQYLPKESKLSDFLNLKAQQMLAWLSNISYKNGSIPHFNDSTEGIAFTSPQLLAMAEKLNIEREGGLRLKESGYRKFVHLECEMFMDVHGIGPEYQPGHAHADTFTFCLSHKGQPVIVDPGISTYNISPQREWQRSTAAHNTVTINGENSSETWSGFRVGKRAIVKVIEDNENAVSAQHSGYEGKGILTKRIFSTFSKGIMIEDFLEGWNEGIVAVSRIHFHPAAIIEELGKNELLINGNIKLGFNSEHSYQLEPYDYSLGYNKLLEGKRLIITLTNSTCNISLTILP